MSTIRDFKSKLNQKALDALCTKYHIPACVHPSLPGPDNNILQSPDGKIGVYIQFFYFANYRIPLSQFLVDVLDYFRIHLSQLSVFGAAKVSHFEILCRVHGFQPSVNCFCAFYTSSYTKGWMSFVKRSDAAPVCHCKPLDSVKNWNDHFFWVDSTVFPLFVSLKIKILSKDPAPKLSQYDADASYEVNTVTLGSSHEVRSLGDELRPLRDELRLLGAGVRLYGTKDKPHRSEARARRLDHDNGVETRVYGQRLRDEETIVMVFGRSMYSRTMI
ncbi:hypothetical protein Tco_1138365 [Tanacetum coccineum]